jgi:hypothetical protein
VLSKSGLPALKDRLEREYLIHHFRRLGGDTDALCRFLSSWFLVDSIHGNPLEPLPSTSYVPHRLQALPHAELRRET